MPRFLSGFRPLLVILAVVLAAGCGSKEEDATKYAKSISDRHEALAEALVLYGRMISAFHKEQAVIDSNDYIAAEETMKGYMERIGSLRSLEKMRLPGNSEDLKSVHDYFMISASYLYESQNLLEESGYDKGTSAMALDMWEKARKNFLTFAELLNQLEGKLPLEEGTSPRDATVSEASALEAP